MIVLVILKKVIDDSVGDIKTVIDDSVGDIKKIVDNVSAVYKICRQKKKKNTLLL